jgi:hypothetical protein
MEAVLIILSVLLAMTWCEHPRWDGPVYALRRLLYLKAQRHRGRSRASAEEKFQEFRGDIQLRVVTEETDRAKNGRVPRSRYVTAAQGDR